jgi:hypothetical protein
MKSRELRESSRGRASDMPFQIGETAQDENLHANLQADLHVGRKKVCAKLEELDKLEVLN